jgi:small conductance mechanosensitive channel
LIKFFKAVLVFWFGLMPLSAYAGPPASPAITGLAGQAGESAPGAGAEPAEAGPREAQAQEGAGEEGRKGASSVAEQITRLRRSIEVDQERLEALEADRDDPQSEYAEASAAFDRLDKKLAEQAALLEDPSALDEKALAEARERHDRLEKARALAKERFDLAIDGRKVGGEQIENLRTKIERDRKALGRLEGGGEDEPATAAPATAAPATAAPAAPAPAAPEAAGVAAPAAPAAGPALVNPLAPAAGAQPAAEVPAAGGGRGAEPVRKDLEEARTDAATKTAASKEAEETAQSITERVAAIQKEIELEQKLLVNVRKQRDNARETRLSLTGAFRERSLAGAPREDLDLLQTRLGESEERLQAANQSVHEHALRLDDLQSELASLQADQIEALKAAQAAQAEVADAERTIRRLENPFSPRNVLQWLIDHGPRLLLVVLAMAFGHWVSRFFSERVIRLLAHSGARGSSIEREARARTLVGVFHNAASVVIVVGGGMMFLQEAGIPIGPLLGGAAVFGLAVAFGAQNLIRDYFYGFVILLENQYKLNDVVEIGGLSGQVEKITLRMTVLRDLEGRVHFLPNGGVTAVTNFTHGWSRALFDVQVAYKENVDQVMAVIMSLAHDLQRDPGFAPLILEGATMLGVDSLSDSGITIKFYIKTRPLQQWTIKRELLRRIKNRFDEVGIEIPYPQRVVHHRQDGQSAPGMYEAAPGHSLILHGNPAAR